MRKNLGWMVGVALGGLVVLLLGRAALGQGSDLLPGGDSPPASHSGTPLQGEAQNPRASADQRTEAIPEEGKSLRPDASRSSDPIPAGEDSPCPGSSPAPSPVEEEVTAPAQTLASLRVLGSVLRPRDSDVEWHNAGSGGCIYAVSGDDWVVWNTPIYLPQGATVRRVRMYWFDENVPVDCMGWFTVYDYLGVPVTEWSISSEGKSGFDYSSTPDFSHTIDYDLYSYVLNWRPCALGQDIQLCGFRIYYEPPPGPVFVPAVQRND